MIYTKYKYTPIDIAAYIITEDVTYSAQNRLIDSLFSKHNKDIVHPYRNDYELFRKSVKHFLLLAELDDREYTEAELIMKELSGSGFDELGEADYFGAYFKLIKLQLLYSGKEYKKIKFSTLLHDFGYKRRSEKLNDSIKKALSALGLKTYLKGRVPCDICDVKLNDTIIIRID